MAFELKKAKRSMARLKLGISGPSGAGKTLSSLLIGYGLLKQANPTLPDEAIWEQICIIDTENGSGSLYVGKEIYGIRIGEYYAIDIAPPFTPQSYMDAITACEKGGISFLIIDSLSHAWSGEGGMLDMQGNIAKRSGNSYTAWRDVTPLHNRLVDKIMQCDMHVILAMRVKTEYVLEQNERGKQTPRKVGLAPVFRDGVEYECTTFFEVALDHTASASKDRTGVFDQQFFTIDPATGSKLYKWLEGGDMSRPAVTMQPASAAKSSAPQPTHTPQPAAQDDADAFDDLPFGNDAPQEPLAEAVTQQMLTSRIDQMLSGMSRDEQRAIAEKIKSVNGGSANYKNVSDPATRETIYNLFVA